MSNKLEYKGGKPSEGTTIPPFRWRFGAFSILLAGFICMALMAENEGYVILQIVSYVFVVFFASSLVAFSLLRYSHSLTEELKEPPFTPPTLEEVDYYCRGLRAQWGIDDLILKDKRFLKWIRWIDHVSFYEYHSGNNWAEIDKSLTNWKMLAERQIIDFVERVKDEQTKSKQLEDDFIKMYDDRHK